jgi:histone H3/H4
MSKSQAPNEFDGLKKKIKKTFPNEAFANLPRKHLVGNLNADVVEARRIMLERYLQEIIMNPVVRDSELARTFLELDKIGPKD